MKDLKDKMLLYAVTDRRWLHEETLSQQVEQVLKGGATFLQLREKQLDKAAFLQEAKLIKKLAEAYRVPFVINDNVEIANKVDADGIHIGQGDSSIQEARKLLGVEKIIGVTAKTVEQARDAERNGADYLGVGAVFQTSTKSDAIGITIEELKKIRQAVCIPIVAIGGITAENVLQLKGTGIDGIAVVSAVFAQENIQIATRKLVQLAKMIV